MGKKSVALMRYAPKQKVVEKAISLCDGAKNLKPYYKVLIKPNIVIGGKLYKNFIKGVVTSTSILEEILLYLKEFGCTDITIGEGSVLLPELGADTLSAFKYSGISDLAKKHDVKLIDFYGCPFNDVVIGGENFQISTPVLESDFIINVPVLKTHNQTKVSLSIKNIKGVLNFKSKKKFHNLDLERYIAALGAFIKPQLNIIDGLYTVNNGPVSLDWREVGIVLAGDDPLAVDMVGTKILGFEPYEIAHLKEYVAITGGLLDIESIILKGESLGCFSLNSQWDSPYLEEIIKMHQVKGVSVPRPGPSLCSSCGFGIAMALHLFFREIPGRSFDRVEVCTSKEVKASPNSKQVFLLGKCAIDTNKNIPSKIEVKGCPPKINDIQDKLRQHLPVSI